MQLLLLRVSLLFCWASSSFARPADPYILKSWTFNDPRYDPPPEPLVPYCNEGFPYGAESNVIPHNGASSSEAIRYQKDFDLNEEAPAEEQIMKEQLLIPWRSHPDHQAVRTLFQESYEVRFKKARANFLQTAKEMGRVLSNDQFKSRFKFYAPENLREDLLYGDDEAKRLATASILMNRPAQAKRNKFNVNSLAGNESVFQGLKKEQVLERLYHVMTSAPTEDLRQWWYHRILLARDRQDIFEDLYSNNRERQIKAIKFITGLYPLGHFWVIDRPRPAPRWAYNI